MPSAVLPQPARTVKNKSVQQEYCSMSFKTKLKAAKELYVQHQYHEALEHVTSALQDNEESPDGLL